MASRQFPQMQFSNLPAAQLSPVRYEATMLPHGVDPATMGEGDPRESYMTPARIDVGKYKVTTVDSFAAAYRARVDTMMGDGSFVSTTVKSVTRNADKTLTIEFWVYNSAAALFDPDAANGDAFFLELVLRNTELGAP